MLPDYSPTLSNYTKTENERVIYEGIYVSLSASSGEFLLEMVEEIIHDTVSGEERVVMIYDDTPVIIKYEKVAIISYPGKNITQNGAVSVQKLNKPEPPKVKKI